MPYLAPSAADEDEDDVTNEASARPVQHRAAVTALEQSPAPDVVAIGFMNGFISVVNLKYDKQVSRCYV